MKEKGIQACTVCRPILAIIILHFEFKSTEYIIMGRLGCRNVIYSNPCGVPNYAFPYVMSRWGGWSSHIVFLCLFMLTRTQSFNNWKHTAGIHYFHSWKSPCIVNSWGCDSYIKLERIHNAWLSSWHTCRKEVLSHSPRTRANLSLVTQYSWECGNGALENNCPGWPLPSLDFTMASICME